MIDKFLITVMLTYRLSEYANTFSLYSDGVIDLEELDQNLVMEEFENILECYDKWAKGFLIQPKSIYHYQEELDPEDTVDHAISDLYEIIRIVNSVAVGHTKIDSIEEDLSFKLRSVKAVIDGLYPTITF